VQANTGSASAVSSVSATVPAGTVEGDTGIICMFGATPLTPPEQWEFAAADPTVFLAVMCRGDLLGGESSWPFSSVGGVNAIWSWTAGEWGNTAPAPVETSAAVSGTPGASSLSTGSTGTFGTQFVMGVAAFAMFSSNASAAWPSVSYSGGFAETDSVQVGDGTHAGDVHLWVARLYGADSDTGPWSCTATFTGSMTSKVPYAALAVFRAQETADAPMSVLAGSGGAV
jgi:hypothetical protein